MAGLLSDIPFPEPDARQLRERFASVLPKQEPGNIHQLVDLGLHARDRARRALLEIVETSDGIVTLFGALGLATALLREDLVSIEEVCRALQSTEQMSAGSK